MSSRKGNFAACGSSSRYLTSEAVSYRIASGLALNSCESGASNDADVTFTSSPGRQTKLRPKISGCRVRMKTLTRQSGKPALTSRSQVSDIIWVGLGADLAPSISQSASFCRSGAFMAAPFATQVFRTSRRVNGRRPVVALIPDTRWRPAARCARGLHKTLRLEDARKRADGAAQHPGNDGAAALQSSSPPNSARRPAPDEYRKSPIDESAYSRSMAWYW